MPIHVATETELLDVLSQKMGEKQPLLVGIDGFMGSGKTYLAMKVASGLGGIRLSLDSYADPGSDESHYVKKLRLDYFVEDVAKLKDKFPCLVIEGICLLEVLDEVKTNIDSLVYIKRVSKQGLWHDGYHLEDYKTDKAIKENEQGLPKSELEYHVAYEPHEKADIIFERQETNEA